MKYVLDFGKDHIEVEVEEDGGGMLTSNLKEDCKDPPSKCLYCAAIDGMESLILAHACAGMDITSPQYKEGIQTCLDAVGNCFD
jgi:hypothetical protein